MTAALDIIVAAYRESNNLAIGREPSDPQKAEALTRLRNLVSSVFGVDVGENLEDWPIGINNVNQHWPRDWKFWNQDIWSYPRINVRLLLNATGSQNIYLPVDPDDGARLAIVPVTMNLATYPVTLHGNGRLIDGNNLVVLNNNATAARVYMYRADLASWMPVTSITALDSVLPFPDEFDDYFITKLAMRLNPRYGRAVQAESRERLEEQRQQLQARYAQSRNMPAPMAVNNLSTPYRFFQGRRGGPYGWMP